MDKRKKMTPKRHKVLGGVKRTERKPCDLAAMTIDDMFTMVGQDENFDDMSKRKIKKPETNNSGKEKIFANKPKKKHNKKSKEIKSAVNEELDSDEELEQIGIASQKEYLEQLKLSDPEFYKAMMSSDILESDDEDPEMDRGGQLFEAPGELEVDSDESDAEQEMLCARGENMVTATMIAGWETELSGEQPLDTFRMVEQALLAALESLGNGSEETKTQTSKFKVEGAQIFNSIVRLCLRNVPQALPKILHMKSLQDDPTKSKRWPKMRNYIKPYLRDLVKLCEAVSEPSVIEVLINKGIIPILGYYAGHASVCRLLLKRLIALWATSEKRVRVVSFIAIFRLTRSLQSEFLDWVLKQLYLAYVKNCHFTSPSSWGSIDFMRLSLVELYALDQSLAYRHAFVYIRQMAFHLRNAVTVKQKQSVQLVYNWQYIHCLHMWADLLSKTHPSVVLQPLIHPLTQIALGTVRLQQTPNYFPLVFHVCGILTGLSKSTKTFIPVLPCLLEVLLSPSLNVKHRKASIRPYNWLCMLRLSKSQMAESAFRDGVIEQCYDAFVDYLSIESASIGFPELVVPTILLLKDFLKKSKVPMHTKKIRQLFDKVNENSKFIENERRSVTFGIADSQAVTNWEVSVRQAGTPLGIYNENWRKIRAKDHLRRDAQRESLDDYDLPTIRRKELEDKRDAKSKGKSNRKDAKDLFESDTDDSDDEDGNQFISKKSSTNIEEDSSGENDDDGPHNILKKKGNLGKNLKANNKIEVVKLLAEEEGLLDGDEDAVKEMKLSDLEDEDDNEFLADEFEDDDE